MRPASSDDVLRVEHLSIELCLSNRQATIVSDVSFSLRRGRSLGLVGESGSGKSTLALAVMGLLRNEAGMRVRGQVFHGALDLLSLPNQELRKIQGRDLAMIFQDPMSALNPVHRVGDQIIEALRAHEIVDAATAVQRSEQALASVGMPEPRATMRRYPHQLSGGQRQRVMIAMANIARPKVLIADEPTTALDLTIQAQTLSLLRTLSHEHDMALLLVTHDLGVVSEMCDEVMVLYAGRVVEQGPTASVLTSPQHPYTAGLLRAHPSLDSSDAMLEAIEGGPPPIFERPAGCGFAPRCDRASSMCGSAPKLAATDTDPTRLTACHHPLDTRSPELRAENATHA